MARARNIKPAFFQDDKLGVIPSLARLLFIGMWTIADFKGCLEYRPKMLKVQILPYDDCDIELLTNNLEQARFIRFYSEKEKRYIKIVNFEKHQNPHKNERDAGSDIPDFNDTDEIQQKNKDVQKDGTKSDLIGSTRADSLLLIPSSLIPDSPSLIPKVTGAEKSAPTKNHTEKSETELQTACRNTWGEYCNAYFERYGTEPVRNKKVNSQVKQFVERIGFDESPHVARFFVTSNANYYVLRMHDWGTLLKDAEKIRTEWVTGKSMTATRARQLDQSQANAGVAEEALRIIEQQGGGA